MLEPIGVFGAIGRGYRLTRKAFWRTFGIGMLTLLVTSIAGQSWRYRSPWSARWPRSPAPRASTAPSS